MTEADATFEFRMIVTKTELMEDGKARVHLSEYGQDAKTDCDIVVVGSENFGGLVVGRLFSLRLTPHERKP